MDPRGILIAALLLVVIVVAMIVGWSAGGDRPGPLNLIVSRPLLEVSAPAR